MTKVNMLLALALLLSALYLVRTSYEARRLYSDLDKAKAEHARLDVDFKRLEADAQGAATSVRVDRRARDRLAMRPASPAVTQYVVDPMPAGSAAASGAQR
ncbi:cell division protein FtsL [Burkholderiales bacterium JOSHI_001]|nr:cell division protein FtsL [Burkholderiales bacterium JOSHI_001]